MVRGDVRHSVVPSGGRSGRRLRVAGASLVALVLVLAGLSYAFDLGPRFLGWDRPSPLTEPAEVAPPPGLDLPSPSVAPEVATPLSPGAANRTAVRRAVAGLVGDEDLGRRVAVAVRDLSDGEAVYAIGPSPVTPASTMKLLTTTAALAALGPDHRFRTTVVADASARRVVLVGGGDPLLGRAPDEEAWPLRADVVNLARLAARALQESGRTRVRLGYDASLFTGPAVSPSWPASYVAEDVVSPISSLWVDAGRERTGLTPREADPAAAAAAVFARALAREGVTVVGTPRPATQPAEATEIAAVESAPLEAIVQRVLEVSDNEGAEVLLRHVALAEGRPASFAGGAAAVRDVLGRLGVDFAGARIHDGSGLSRRDRLAPGTLLDVVGLGASGEHPELRRAVAGLPVAGFTGSLALRFATAPTAALGEVRAKTGTLTGVHGLAGVVTTRDGSLLSFVAVADRVAPIDTLDARERLDQVAAALAACRCAA